MATNNLKKPTELQLLLEEINFQRTKEMRQLLKDGDGGFVMLQGTTYWTDLFVRHFLFQSEPEHNIDSDDLLFFVRKKHIKGSSRNMPKFDTEIDVFRKDSRKLPIGDPDVDWEETVYLNLVIHQFNYTLTLAICTRTSPKELQVLKRHSQRVYASPSRRKMDTKGDSEEITYPHICFMVDNFDEVFSDILVRDGEMVCVELVANDKDGSVQGVIFLGSIRYDALKKVYDARQSSLSTKMAQRMTFGIFNSSGPQTRCEFVRMKGPQGKGHAEMAVTKPKGSGVETPTSEPGFSVADMWDSEWDEDPEDFYNYRHQRRLSDPSASLTNFNRYGAWRTKGGQENNASAGAKSRSENEGLDKWIDEVSEIEAGDLKDDRPAFSASDNQLAAGAIIKSPTTCCNCFAPKKRWSDSASGQMSDVYCRKCDDIDSPACLANITPKKMQIKNRTILTVESEIELPNGTKSKSKSSFKKEKEHLNNNNFKKRHEEYEMADDATSLNDAPHDDLSKIDILNDFDSKLRIRVNGKEELPATTTKTKNPSKKIINRPFDIETIVINDNKKKDDFNGNLGMDKRLSRIYSTLPKRKRDKMHHSMWYAKPNSLRVPKRTTPDGTNIYYWCDLPKRALKELDDGAYNPLWAQRGFTQTFHFWKEHRRQQSTPLNAFLTYVTLPWWSIAKDLLDHRETPILTF